MLYLVSTPIGNLEDITLRALSVLKQVDLILCEDTRKSLVILKKYLISTHYESFHKFNEQKKLQTVLKLLIDGKNIALISDAGTPLINDPGFELVNSCIKNDIKVTSVPGPCSIISALILSGLSNTPFQFVGFLPKKGASFLKKILYYTGVTVAFESPHRILKTVKEIELLDPERNLVIVRELTKTFENVIPGKPKDLILYLEKQKQLGEVILLIEKNDQYLLSSDDEIIVEAFQEYFGMSLKDAVKSAAKALKKPKKILYKKNI